MEADITVRDRRKEFENENKWGEENIILRGDLAKLDENEYNFFLILDSGYELVISKKVIDKLISSEVLKRMKGKK